MAEDQGLSVGESGRAVEMIVITIAGRPPAAQGPLFLAVLILLKELPEPEVSDTTGGDSSTKTKSCLI